MATAAGRGSKTDAALAQQGDRPVAPAPGQSVATADANQVMVISAQTRELFAGMAMMIPTSEGNGAENIVLQILRATTWDELDNPWKTDKADEMIGIEVAIDSVTRHASSYADGLGIFLVIHGHEVKSGDEVYYTSGSVSVVAQLVRAYALGAFPLYTVLRKADRPTEKGYYPHHLEILASSGQGSVEA